MKIILLKDVSNVGTTGEVREVSDGYAKNFLFEKKLAIPASAQLIEKNHKEEQEKHIKQVKQLAMAQDLKQKLENKIFVIKAKADKNTLFAAIHESEIFKAIANKVGIEFEENQIKISKPIKTLGQHEVELNLSDNLKAKIKLDIQGLSS